MAPRDDALLCIIATATAQTSPETTPISRAVQTVTGRVTFTSGEKRKVADARLRWPDPVQDRGRESGDGRLEQGHIWRSHLRLARTDPALIEIIDTVVGQCISDGFAVSSLSASIARWAFARIGDCVRAVPFLVPLALIEIHVLSTVGCLAPCEVTFGRRPATPRRPSVV
jgi:hypothetical protein